MSKGPARFAWGEACAIAQAALLLCGAHVVRAALAGSLRRGRDLVGDIDLVVELDPANPWAQSQLGAELMQRLNYDVTREGDHTMHLEPRVSFVGQIVARPAIDVYLATAETWGITLLVRTGSAAHNIRLARRGQLRLPSRRLTVSRGIVDTADKVVASRTEEDCFAALGLPFIEPADREAPELEHMVRVETP